MISPLLFLLQVLAKRNRPIYKYIISNQSQLWNKDLYKLGEIIVSAFSVVLRNSKTFAIAANRIFVSEFLLFSIQFSHSAVSDCDSLRPNGLQHVRLPCPSPTPRVCSNLCPSSQWCHPTISSSVVPFSSCLHLSQHQGLFQWVCSLHQVAKVLQFQSQHQSFQWIFRVDFL